MLPAGLAQLVLIGMGMLLVAGTNGTAAAMVANLTHYSVHGTAFATLTLVNNLLGLAPGPFITGRLSDLVGLHGALQWLVLMSIAAAVVFFYTRHYYLNDIARSKGDEVAEAACKPACEVLS